MRVDITFGVRMERIVGPQSCTQKTYTTKDYATVHQQMNVETASRLCESSSAKKITAGNLPAAK